MGNARLCECADSDTLVAEVAVFARKQYSYKFYGNDNVQENNKGAGSYPVRLIITILILKEHLHLSSPETTVRALYDLRYSFALVIVSICNPFPGMSTINLFSGMMKVSIEHKIEELGMKFSIFNEMIRQPRRIIKQIL